MSDRDQRLTFVILWLFAMMNYIYGDIAMIFSLLVHPEQLARLQQGLTAGGKEDLYFLGGAIFMNVRVPDAARIVAREPQCRPPGEYRRRRNLHSSDGGNPARATWTRSNAPGQLP